MQETGLFDELMTLQSIDSLFLLTPTDHPRRALASDPQIRALVEEPDPSAQTAR